MVFCLDLLCLRAPVASWKIVEQQEEFIGLYLEDFADGAWVL